MLVNKGRGPGGVKINFVDLGTNNIESGHQEQVFAQKNTIFYIIMRNRLDKNRKFKYKIYKLKNFLFFL